MTRRILPVLLVLCMLLNMFLAMPTVASAEVIGSASVWRTNAIIYPAQEQLIPAGPIWVKWNALANAVRYVVYLDDKPGEVVKRLLKAPWSTKYILLMSILIPSGSKPSYQTDRRF
ncbi:MAG TPA: hypothetical protein GXX26_03040 [Clostridiaceae bacterium]|nr:hypothetical protein [Clostridiaceae bacterium]